MFYFSFIESLLTFSFLAWFNNLNVQNSAKLNRVLRHSQKVVGDTLPTLSFTYEKRAVRKARRVSGDTLHFLSQYIRRLPSGRRFEAPPVRTERHKKSFVPTAVRLLNGAFWGAVGQSAWWLKRSDSFGGTSPTISISAIFLKLDCDIMPILGDLFYAHWLKQL